MPSYTIYRIGDRACHEERRDERRQRRRRRDREDLHVVAHVKHHPPRGEHRAQRQQDRENREAAQLESNGGQQTKKSRESEPDPEGRERDDKCVRDHAASLYPMPQTVSRYFGSDGSSSEPRASAAHGRSRFPCRVLLYTPTLVP